MTIEENLLSAQKVISEADAILITAGAGIGVDSGLPDFRGNEGFWKAYPPIAKLGISFVEMANPSWFSQNPKLAWAFYGHRLNLYRNTIPHTGFDLLLNLAEKKNNNYFVFTSNVDGQFQKAGFSEDKIEECHGSINHFQCAEPCGQKIWDAKDIEVFVDEDNFQAQDPLPACSYCGEVARPNILMFGDWSWIGSRSQRQSDYLNSWCTQVDNNNLKLVIIELGAGTAVATVRYTSENIARQYRATLIRINPRDYPVPSGHISIPLGALEGIQTILDSVLS